MVITKLALPRRTFLRGVGATMALPLLDAMVPAMKAAAPAAPRFAADLLRQRREHARVDACRDGGRLRALADPEPARGRSATGRWSSRGSTTSRRRIRETSAGSTRAPRRPS